MKQCIIILPSVNYIEQHRVNKLKISSLGNFKAISKELRALFSINKSANGIKPFNARSENKKKIYKLRGVREIR